LTGSSEGLSLFHEHTTQDKALEQSIYFVAVSDGTRIKSKIQTDKMAPSKSGYYESYRSSSEGERVDYNPRREDRERSTASSTKKRTVVVTYGGKTGDPARKADYSDKHWK
jgi:hypothetical protein